METAGQARRLYKLTHELLMQLRRSDLRTSGEPLEDEVKFWLDLIEKMLIKVRNDTLDKYAAVAAAEPEQQQKVRKCGHVFEK
jgi:hypothetical protein